MSSAACRTAQEMNALPRLSTGYDIEHDGAEQAQKIIIRFDILCSTQAKRIARVYHEPPRWLVACRRTRGNRPRAAVSS